MSRYKGELHVTESNVDGHRIDEIETMRNAVDHLSQYLAKLAGDSNEAFHSGWPVQNIAETISDLCAMLVPREEEREGERAKEAARS